MQKCDVCGSTENLYVLCSPFGAMSNCYCETCAKQKLEPYGDLLMAAWLADSYENCTNYVKNIIDINLHYYNKTLDDFKADLIDFANEMNMPCNSSDDSFDNDLFMES